MTIPRLSRTIWTIIIGVGVVASAIVSLFVIEDRYAKAKDLVHLEAEVDEDIHDKLLLVETKTVQTFESYQMKQEASTKSIQLQMINMEAERLDHRCKYLRRQLRVYPNDVELQEELQITRQQQTELRKRRQQLLSD